MVKERQEYLSYLVRLWRASGAGERTWLASIESAKTGEKLGFGSLDELFEFLRKQMGAASDERDGIE